MDERASAEFERAVLAHLDAAYCLARWLTRDEQAAEDLVQDSCVRALRSFGGFRGENPRAWLLAIVRNACYSWLSKRKTAASAVEFDDEAEAPGAAQDRAALAERGAQSRALRQALEELPPEFREAIVLRELEGLSYREIAAAAGVPLGTVMSRLARARRRLERVLAPPAREEG